MVLSGKAQKFLASSQASEVRRELEHMVNDSRYNTRSTYSSLAQGYVPFVDKHIKYLSLHLDIDPAQYLSNLKLMTRYN